MPSEASLFFDRAALARTPRVHGLVPVVAPPDASSCRGRLPRRASSISPAPRLRFHRARSFQRERPGTLFHASLLLLLARVRAGLSSNLVIPTELARVFLRAVRARRATEWRDLSSIAAPT